MKNPLASVVFTFFVITLAQKVNGACSNRHACCKVQKLQCEEVFWHLQCDKQNWQNHDRTTSQDSLQRWLSARASMFICCSSSFVRASAPHKVYDTVWHETRNKYGFPELDDHLKSRCTQLMQLSLIIYWRIGANRNNFSLCSSLRVVVWMVKNSYLLCQVGLIIRVLTFLWGWHKNVSQCPLFWSPVCTKGSIFHVQSIPAGCQCNVVQWFFQTWGQGSYTVQKWFLWNHTMTFWDRNLFCKVRTHFYHDASTHDHFCDRRVVEKSFFQLKLDDVDQ